MRDRDPEAAAGRSAPVGERHDGRLAVAHDEQAVHLLAPVIALENRLLLGRLHERGVQVALHIAERLAQEETALAGRIRGLEHRGKPRALDRGRDLVL